MSPISRHVLSDQVEDHLVQAILSGQYPPGSRIVESRVARELGVSQAPVREALRDLEALGLVEIQPFRGASVRSPSKAELLEGYAVRAELESLGARLALTRISDADLDELGGYIEAMREAAALGDRHAEALVDGRFHERLIEIAGSSTLDRVWRYLVPVARTYITLTSPGVDARIAADLHLPILQALRERDPEQAVAAVHRHFEAAGATFDASFDEGIAPAVNGASPVASSGAVGAPVEPNSGVQAPVQRAGTNGAVAPEGRAGTVGAAAATTRGRPA